jgi:uncharacterized protein YciI
MTYYAVTREPGVAWDASRSMREQDAWDEHAAFMDTLADAGLVVLGGPLEDGAVLLIVHAESKDEIQAWLSQDPWASMDLLPITEIQRRQILLGDEASLGGVGCKHGSS